MGFELATGIRRYGKDDFLNDVFITEESFSELTSLLERKRNIILQGPPGTGKTYAAKRIAYAMMGATDDSCIEFVQFHQNSSYEDYVVGYRPQEDGRFAAIPGKFTEFFRKASKGDGQLQKYFLIIDEINRANISKVFGELLMLIEANHRDEELEVPGLKEKLSVPSNVYIIGMMNTADRSIALVDYALRRRFAFYSMKPAFDVPKFHEMVQGFNNQKLMKLIEAVKELNGRIAKDDSLGEGYCIGHSYFCFGDQPSDSDIKSVVDFELVPLLREYWFDPLEKDKLDNEIAALQKAVS